MPEWFGGSALNSNFELPEKHHWLFQLSRLKRWLDETKEIQQKAVTVQLDSFDQDKIIAFFQNCYHLKDWLESSRPTLKDEINTLFHTNIELGICRDVCNGFKHKKLRDASYDPDFNWYRVYDHFEALNDDKNPVRYRIAIEKDSKLLIYDIFELIAVCFRLWSVFIKDHSADLDIKIGSDNSIRINEYRKD